VEIEAVQFRLCLSEVEARELVRGDRAKARSCRRGREPWRTKSPKEPCARVGLNRRHEVADSGVEQGPEGEGRTERRKPGPQDAEKSEGRWETMRKEERHNDKRAKASETANGCTRGTKL
jgi:hypothetical protein